MYKLSTTSVSIILVVIGIMFCLSAIIISIIQLQHYYAIISNPIECEVCEICESPYLPEVKYLPETIDCDTQIMEGDIIPARIYSPFGEWEMIIPAEIDYQLKYGARVIQCK